ncbi:MAG: hypothetical protein MUC42_03235, partial [Bryobacter sp.]|nr:hypothetical protein [Bryobacter sp.]
MNSAQMYLIAAASMVGYLMLTWLLVDKLGLSTTVAWIVRLVLAALGMAALGAWYWWKHRRGKTSATALEAAAELDPVIHDAEQRLAASPLGKEARVSTLPVIITLGESGSAKTSILVHGGVAPELIGGHVYQEGFIVPTRGVNLWFTGSAVLAEAGGKILNDPERWPALLNRLKPSRARSVFGGGRQSPRSAIVCLDAELLLKAGAQAALTETARKLNARLSDVCRALGTQLPVYVIFTRCDTVPFFREFVANLSDEEARQVVGATVPMATAGHSGVYADEEARRLTEAFQSLFLGLAAQRPVLLAREHQAPNLPAVYEFPREFRKLRGLAVQFLVDLCRPSQLQTSPYLRGFYFAGVRPVEVREVVKAPQAAAPSRSGADATGLFGLDGARIESAPLQAARVQTRRVPQWVFLGQLFNDVILKDQTAFQASSRSLGADRWRRGLAIAGCVLAAALAIAWSVSFARNRALGQQVQDAVSAIASSRPQGGELASREALERLETLRQSVEQLSRYSREGAPWSLRWGLYQGDRLLPIVRTLYFSRFHQILFASTQDGLLEHLRKLPAAPGPNDEYGYTYDTLKAYLITTSHHEKSTKLFLSPLLTTRWAGKQQVEPARRALAQKQFDFYSEELKYANPFSSENDSLAIDRARRFLAQFAASERIYQFMVAEANRRHPPINYNKQVAGSAQVITNNKDVAGAFTNQGWAFMTEAIRNFEKFFAGEEWVLGPQASAALDRAKIEPELLARYRADFLGNWREYLRNSTVLRYASVEDAARKLGQMANNTSHLLALFCIASVHTSAATQPEVKDIFQPVQYVTPAGCPDRYVGQNNQAYMTGLAGLQAALEQASRARDPNDPAISATLSQAASAKLAARQVAQNFQLDKEGKVEQTVQKLMEDPITYVEGLLGRLGPAQVNGEARRFCTEFAGVVNKYPFNTASRVDASLEELNAVFKPGSGSLWLFYEQNLKQHLVRQGPQYVAAPNATIRI